MKIAFFTICAKNYLAYAKTLMDSLQEQYSNALCFVILSDRIDSYFDPEKEKFSVLEVQDYLSKADLDDMSFRYEITEFSTAIKPKAFLHLFRKFDFDAVVYLDPDILVIQKLTEVEKLLKDGAEAVVTPHICSPVEDGDKPDDQSMLQVGIYNFGFVALARSKSTHAFLVWWHRKLKRDCRIDLAEGLFVDQKWADLLPAFVEHTAILRHPGYNVAYWNLLNRKISKDSNGWKSNGLPLVFFHFSGVESPDPKVFSKHQTRFHTGNIGTVKNLLREYRKRVKDNGHKEISIWPYAYGVSDNGSTISTIIRRVYREEVAPLQKTQDSPFLSTVAYCNAPEENVVVLGDFIITHLMFRIWNLRPDLQQAFDFMSLEGQTGFVNWYVHSATRELKLDPAFLVAETEYSSRIEIINFITEESNYKNSSPEEHAPPKVGGLTLFARWMLETITRFRRYYIHLPVGARNKVKIPLLRAAAGGMHPQKDVITPAEDNEQPKEELLPGALLVGYPKAELGMGEHVRLSALAFSQADAPFAIYDFNHNVAARQQDDRFSHWIADEANFKVNIFHINADQMPVAQGILGNAFFNGRYNIGYWAWELSGFPDAWLPSVEMVDEIWAPSRFIQQAIAAKANCPVKWMPLAVQVDEPNPLLDRAYFHIPKDSFVFLFYYDLASYSSRKNPKGAIEAFRRAFPDKKKDVILVIKTMGREWHTDELEQLKIMTDEDERIMLIDAVLSHDEMPSLVNVCNCFVSLHRSEGFGRGMAEAMCLGKPVIATNYSGNTDFMDADNACLVNYTLIPVQEGEYPHATGQVWADPDLDGAVKWMKKLVDDKTLCQKIGQNAQEAIKAMHSPAKIGKKYKNRLQQLGYLV